MPQEFLRNPGDLRTWLEFQTSTQQKDEAGGLYEDFETDFACWGRIIPNRGQEIFQSNRFTSKVDGIIEIRYRTGVTTKHRVQVIGTDRVLKIDSYFDPDSRKSRLYIAFVEEVV